MKFNFSSPGLSRLCGLFMAVVRPVAPILLLLVVIVSACCGQAPRILRVGKIEAEFRPTAGLYLRYDDVPIIRGSLFQLFAANPQESFGSGSSGATVTVSPTADGGQQIHALYRDRSGSRLEASETITIAPEGSVTLRLEGMWRGAGPAAIEWAAGKIWSYPLAGYPFTAVPFAASSTPFTPLTGVVPAFAKANAPAETMLARNFRSLTFDAAPFRLRVEATSDSPDSQFFDGRRNPSEWPQGDSLFWLGYVDTPVVPGIPFSRTLVLRFQPVLHDAVPAPKIYVRTAAYPLPDASQFVNSSPLIIPQPKQALFRAGSFLLKPRTAVRLCFIDRAPADPRLQAACKAFCAEFDLRQSLCIDKPGGIEIRLLKRNSPAAPVEPEGYRLSVSRSGVRILAHDAAGAFYALQTLHQLVRPTPRPTTGTPRLEIPFTEISDWPSLRFRGAHLFVGSHALPFHKKLIANIFIPFKLNQLVLECEYTRWDSHPGIAVDFSMSKSDLAQEVAFARKRFMEPTPLINSLGHAEWMFKNGQNAAMAEDPEHRAATCPNSEATYAFLFDIYAEALKLFKPKRFHIGHDEITLFSRFPFHPECLAAGATREEAVTNLFMKDIYRVDAWLRERHVQTMLWSDMFLHRSESSDAAANASTIDVAKDRRKRLPQHTVIADWHYQPEPTERYGSLSTFQKAGFPSIATTWYRPENIANFARAAINQGAEGLLQSTWAGYDSREELLRTELKQFSAFVLAAEYAWSGNSLDPDRLAYDATRVFKSNWRGAPDFRQRSGWSLDLTAVYNVRLDSLAKLTDAPRRMEGVKFGFRHDSRASAPNAILLAGRLNPASVPSKPESIVLQVKRKARELVFAHGSLFPRGSANPEDAVAIYIIQYKGGKSETITLKEGDQIRPISDSGMLWSADRSWQGVSHDGQSLGIQTLRWKNTRPTIEIESIEFRATDRIAAPLLIGVTGID